MELPRVGRKELVQPSLAGGSLAGRVLSRGDVHRSSSREV